MGNTLNQPVTTKTTETGGEHPNGMKWGVSSMQGWRATMEDAHIVAEVCEVWDAERNEIIWLEQAHYVFGVLDGHGGATAAKFCSEHLLEVLKRQTEFIEYARLVGRQKPQEPSNKRPKQAFNKWPRSPLRGLHSARSSGFPAGTPKRSQQTESHISSLLQRAFEDSFVELDLQLLKFVVEQNIYDLAPDPVTAESALEVSVESGGDDWGVDLAEPETEVVLQESPAKVTPRSSSGTTATVVLVTPDMIICANVGDSRTIVDGYPLSTDHKPTLPEEQQRILDANGIVNFNRVDGELAVSRALGDFEFKAYNQSHLVDGILEMELKRSLAKSLKVSPFPEVTCHKRSDDDRSLILACDGIWDVMYNHECHELVQTLCKEGERNIGLIAEEVLDQCLKKGSRDNMTILVGLMPGQSFGEGGGVYKRRKERPKKYVASDLCHGRCTA